MNEIVKPYCDFYYYPEDMIEEEIKKGQFLDIERTIEFKAKQLSLVSKAFQLGQVKDGDWFLVGDIFFPGIESIKYMAELQDIKVKIASFNYAGRADRYDFVRKLNDWSDYSELSYHMVCDIVFTGSANHKQSIEKYFNVIGDRVIVTGCVWDKDKAFELYPKIDEKEDYVIFPHRLCNEKGIDDFIKVCEMMPEYKFIVTSSSKNKSDIVFPSNVEYRYGLTKKEYYEIMSKAKYYLSTAYQETFGYTLREALMYNCIIAAPNRVCYPDMLPENVLYNNLEEIKTIFENGLIMGEDIVNQYSNNILEIINYLKNAR